MRVEVKIIMWISDHNKSEKNERFWQFRNTDSKAEMSCGFTKNTMLSLVFNLKKLKIKHLKIRNNLSLSRALIV